MSRLSTILPTALPAALGERWPGSLALIGGGLLGSEIVVHSLHLDVGLIGLGALAGGWWWLSRRPQMPPPQRARTQQEWLDRCQRLLEQFERLEGESGAPARLSRQQELAALNTSPAPKPLDLVVVGTTLPATPLQPLLAAGLRHRRGLRLSWGEPLPSSDHHWSWPVGIEACDVVLYHLPMPLLAVDLRWLEALPADQPVWLLLSGDGRQDPEQALAPLLNRMPAPLSERWLVWDGSAAGLEASLTPLARWLSGEGPALQRATPIRRLERLHGTWQAQLEGLRRREWRQLLQRSQWLVAAGVAASPLASLDLVVMAAANGLMLQEMARIWDCPWTADQLRAVAIELGQACLGLGLVEWSSQALLAVMRLEATGWVVATAVQAVAAAYLTRVVSHAMADYLALSCGVAAPDLAAVKRQAPVLVARAAEAEKLDWAGFVAQAGSWLQSPGARTSNASA